MLRSKVSDFFKLESSAGIILFFTALVAVVIENSSLSGAYESVREMPVSLGVEALSLSKPLILWINDLLMAFFFLLVGLELKREVMAGELSSKDQVLLPLAAAIGGIAVPALLYASYNYGLESMRGWAIPAATDIAFALGVLSLFGSRVPVALKVFLTALAIFDDIAAILIIAFFYTANLSLFALGMAALASLSLYLLNRTGTVQYTPYFLLGAVLWLAILKSGVHATLAGVILGFAIPFRNPIKAWSPLQKLEHALHPWVAFLVLPVFAFFNAGVSFSNLSSETLYDPVSLGILVGLFLGKQIGALGGAWLAVKAGLASLPPRVSWGSVYGVALLSGIGFTMSLFIGNLAFTTPEELTLVRLGVIGGSLLSALAGAAVLMVTLPSTEKTVEIAAGDEEEPVALSA